MVSSEIKRKLKIAFENLANTNVDLNSYKGKLFDVACEIFTSETFVAGIADTLIDGGKIDSKDRIILKSSFILNGSFWVCNNGQIFDLAKDLQLLELASKMENLRQICAKITQ